VDGSDSASVSASVSASASDSDSASASLSLSVNIEGSVYRARTGPPSRLRIVAAASGFALA
ncbi:MAG: hypothetical protein JSV06_00145, partial [Myxococcales bacterium]